jgi:hypothetical protein
MFANKARFPDSDLSAVTENQQLPQDMAMRANRDCARIGLKVVDSTRWVEVHIVSDDAGLFLQ